MLRDITNIFADIPKSIEEGKKIYTICYSSPYYYLYEETENKLVLKSYFEIDCITKKSVLEGVSK